MTLLQLTNVQNSAEYEDVVKKKYFERRKGPKQMIYHWIGKFSVNFRRVQIKLDIRKIFWFRDFPIDLRETVDI